MPDQGCWLTASCAGPRRVPKAGTPGPTALMSGPGRRGRRPGEASTLISGRETVLRTVTEEVTSDAV